MVVLEQAGPRCELCHIDHHVPQTSECICLFNARNAIFSTSVRFQIFLLDKLESSGCILLIENIASVGNGK
jgi:hypothetical protein